MSYHILTHTHSCGTDAQETPLSLTVKILHPVEVRGNTKEFVTDIRLQICTVCNMTLSEVHPLNSKPPMQLPSAATHTFKYSQTKIKGKHFYILWRPPSPTSSQYPKRIACFKVPRLRSLVLVVRVVSAWIWVRLNCGVTLTKEIRSTGRKACRP